MSRLGPLSNRAERRRQAAAWLVRLEDAGASEPDWLAFEAWLGDPDNKRALYDVEAALAVVDDHRSVFRSEPAQPKRTALFFRSAFIAGLASVAAAAVFYQWRPPPVQSFSISAPARATRTVTLADGTTIVLNRGALARVRWSAGERNVELVRGEAAFAVTHNESAPFVVTAGAAVVRDTGTEFNVLREGDELTVTVRTGAVNLSAGGRVFDLAPGDQGKILGERLLVRQVDPEAVLAWRQGRLIYRNVALTEVVADLNRYSETPIRLGDAQVARLRFSGALLIGSGTAMTSELEAFLPIHSEHNAPGIVIRSRTSQDRSPP